MQLSNSEFYLAIDNEQLIDKLNSGKTTVYKHLAIERITYLENQINKLKGALNNNVDTKRTNQSL